MKTVFIVLTLVGILFSLVGVYIKKSKRIEIINLLDESKTYDREKLSAFAGNQLLSMGVLEVIAGCIAFFLKEGSAVLLGTIIISFSILLFFSLKVTLSLKKFEI